MTLALRCRCGQVKGIVSTDRAYVRATCYCKDCQAYGHFLGTEVLDAAGGTEVAAALPAAIRFDGGLEHLACMSLSPKGIYRWYASCCDTPIGNTPRDPAYPSAVTLALIYKTATRDAAAADFLAFATSDHAKRLLEERGGAPLKP